MPLLAGMPVFDLGDVAALRVQAISFFLVVLLASGKIEVWPSAKLPSR